MKGRIVLPVFMGLFIIGVGFAQEKTAPLKEQKEGASYSVGYQIGADFREHKIVLDPEALAMGARDALEGKKPFIAPGVMRQTLLDLQRRIGENKGNEILPYRNPPGRQR